MGDCQALAQQALHAFAGTLFDQQARQVRQPDRDRVLVPDLAGECERLFEQGLGRFEVVAFLMMAGERIERERQPTFVASSRASAADSSKCCCATARWPSASAA